MIILGAKGHVKDILAALPEREAAGLCFFDDLNDYSQNHKLYDRFPVLTHADQLLSKLQEGHQVLIGTGSPESRSILYRKVADLGYDVSVFTMEHCIISEFEVQLNPGVLIMPQVFIGSSVYVGTGSMVNRLAGIHHDVWLGEFCEIGPGVQLLGRCRLGNFVSIGAGAIILPGVSIGDHVTIGAGAVVTKDVLDHQVMTGVPAQSHKK